MATDQGMLGKWYDDYLKSTAKTQPQTPSPDVGASVYPLAPGPGRYGQSPMQTYTPTQATPTEWGADDSQTVQGQVAKITAAGGPLQTLAATRSKQEMNARGMLNSSMAIGAGQKALYEAALPIAQQDANTSAQRGQFNAGQANQTSQFNAASQNEAGQFNASEANKLESARFDLAGKLSMADKDTASKMALQENDAASRLMLQDRAQADALARMSQQFKDNQGMLELQNKLADQSFPKQFAASFTTQMTDKVGAILADPNLKPEGKQNAVQNAIDFANQSLSWIGKMYGVAFPGFTAPAAAPLPTPGTTPADQPGAPADPVDQQAPVMNYTPPPWDQRSDLERNGT
jgi:hypothetical protein